MLLRDMCAGNVGFVSDLIVIFVCGCVGVTVCVLSITCMFRVVRGDFYCAFRHYTESKQ